MKKILFTGIVAIIVFNLVGTSFDPIVTFAQDQPPAGAVATDSGETASVEEALSDASRQVLLQLQTFLSVILMFLNYLIWPLLIMIGVLMDNTLIFGGGMEDKLLQVWSQIRNIVNLLFVVILIGVALYNVAGVGGDDGDYAIKTILPKFILALILVNFSFLGAKLVLDASNIVTSAVFALPNAVEEDLQLVDPDQIAQDICGAAKQAGTGDKICTAADEFTQDAREFFQNLNGSNIAFVMAVNLGQIQKGLEVSEVLRENPNLVNLTVNMIFSIVMYFIYAASFLALFFVLLVRIVVLWIIIAFSPLMALQLVVPNLVSGASGGVDLKDEFVKHATAPIIIGAGMSIGYIMLDTFQRTGVAALGVGWGDDFANVFSSANTLQDLIIAVAAVAIVFKVTFDAANNTYAKGITGGIENFLRTVGGGLSKIPLIIPWVPVANSLDVPDAEGNTDGRLTLGQSFNAITSRINTAVSDGTTYRSASAAAATPMGSRADLNNTLAGRGNSSNNLTALRYLAHNNSRTEQRDTRVERVLTMLNESDRKGDLRSAQQRSAFRELRPLMESEENRNQTLEQFLGDRNRRNLFLQAIGGNALDPATLGAAPAETAAATTTTTTTTPPATTTTTEPPADPPATSG